jgi:hypothetical protein
MLRKSANSLTVHFNDLSKGENDEKMFIDARGFCRLYKCLCGGYTFER